MDSTGKELTVPLCGLSHEVCVAATQPTHWQQLTENTMISISVNGLYVPKELESICDDVHLPRLQLVIKSKYENDEKLKKISWQLYERFFRYPPRFEDVPEYDMVTDQKTAYGSLYNCLPLSLFDTNRCLLGEKNSKIKEIENVLACSITVDQSLPHRYRFITSIQDPNLFRLFDVQIEALVKQAQYQYLFAFASVVGLSITSSIYQMRPVDLSVFPSYQEFQEREVVAENDEQSNKNNTGKSAVDLNQSVQAKTIPDEKISQLDLSETSDDVNNAGAC